MARVLVTGQTTMGTKTRTTAAVLVAVAVVCFVLGAPWNESRPPAAVEPPVRDLESVQEAAPGVVQAMTAPAAHV